MSNDEAISVHQLKLNYGEKKIINIDGIKIKKKEKVFLYGPSGSGKTTLLNLLCGILNPTSGEINLLGEKFTELSNKQKDQKRGTHIGHIFQQFNLINYLNVKENILLPTKINKARMNNENQLKQFEFIVKNLEIENLLDHNIDQLSVGQQQRVAVARSLIGSPEIIIADEPTSALDEEIKNKFIQLLLKVAKDKTILFVSHDKSLAKYFDREINLIDINQQ